MRITLRKWFRYERPKSATAQGWLDFDQAYKKDAPIRYFLTEVLPDYTWYPVNRVYRNIRNAVRFRIVRYHILDTKLGPGYYDKDTLMLYGMFGLLQDYVEVELGMSNDGANYYASKKSTFKQRLNRVPYPFRTTVRELTYRNKEGGLAYLDWEATLDDPNLPPDAQSPQQAVRAREIRDLYLWWTVERPMRGEKTMPPSVAALLDSQPFMYIMSDDFKLNNPKEYALYRAWSAQNTDDGAYWDMEDEENLIRLIKIRGGLWT